MNSVRNSLDARGSVLEREGREFWTLPTYKLLIPLDQREARSPQRSGFNALLVATACSKAPYWR